MSVVVDVAGEVEGDAEQMVTDVADLLEEIDAERDDSASSAPMPVTVLTPSKFTPASLSAPPTPSADSLHDTEDAEVAAVAARNASSQSASTTGAGEVATAAPAPRVETAAVTERPTNPTPYSQGQSDDGTTHRLEQEQAQAQEPAISQTSASAVAAAAAASSSAPSKSKSSVESKSSEQQQLLPQRRLRRGFAVLESDSDEEDDDDGDGPAAAPEARSDAGPSTAAPPVAVQQTKAPATDSATTKATTTTTEAKAAPVLVRRGSAPFLSPSAPDRPQLPDESAAAQGKAATGVVPQKSQVASSTINAVSSAAAAAAATASDEFGFDISFLANFDVDSVVAAATTVQVSCSVTTHSTTTSSQYRPTAHIRVSLCPAIVLLSTL